MGRLARAQTLAPTAADTGTCSTNPNGGDSTSESTSDICDYKDNDCDGTIDEGYSLDGLAIYDPCGPVGECSVGTVECQDGDITCSTWEGGSEDQAEPEVCDGKDNDCDGLIDEGLSATDAIAEDPPGCTVEGVCEPPYITADCAAGVHVGASVG